MIKAITSNLRIKTMKLPSPFICPDLTNSLYLPEDWDFYMCQVDGKIASIYLNLALKEHLPLAQLKYVMYLQFHMVQPREDGLSSGEDFEQLMALEDLLNHELSEQAHAVYVGRVTTDGNRDFFFYLASLEQIEAQIRQIMQSYPIEQYRFGMRLDERADVYLNYLFPSEQTLQEIMARRIED